MTDNTNEEPIRHLYEGQKLLMRVISIESDKQRLGLSLKEVTAAELEQWEERQAEEIAEAQALAEQAAEAAEAEEQEENVEAEV